ncbi:MAG: T9SS type A sorting domain-containing protein [Bacteroidales bacterium]|nr:T9SS type A sorting domain-containing protein [Bacteroidales bacterium]
MKSYKYLLFMVLLGAFSVHAQHSHRCSHKMSYQTSSLSDTLDAVEYIIHIDNLDFSNHTIVARTQVQLKSKIDNLGFVKLELMDLEVDSVKVNGELSSYDHDGAIVTISLLTPLNSGDLVFVNVYYHGQPFHEDWGGFHWSGQYCFNLGVGFESIPHNLGKTWFPCIDDFHDHALYKYYITVEEGKDAVCGGLLDEVVNNGNGTNTFIWHHEHEIPTYLASVAVGDYAWWSKTYNGMNEDIPVWIFTRPSDSSKVDGSFVHLDSILSIYEEKFGPYMLERVGYVGTAIGAMEHACNIAYPNFCIDGGLTYESLYSHELSHMWFGDNVTCASAEDMWLNEGFAVFCDAIMQEFLYSRDQYLDFINGMNKEVIQYCHTPGGDGSYFPLNQIPQNVTYGMSAYDRGATVVHTLRGYFGDEAFFGALAAYNQQFQYSYASSYDLRDLLTSYTGIDMDDWFDNWVFNSGTPHFSVDSFSVVPVAGGADVTVYMRQKRHGPAFTGNSNIVELGFRDNNWNNFTDTIHFNGTTGSSVIFVPFEPAMVLVDPNELMCDAITVYSITISEPDDYSFPDTYAVLEVQEIEDSAFVRIEHNWTPPDSLSSPVQGLTVSDYRYWRVDGNFPENFTATLKFWYSQSGYLDNGILTSPEDSIIVMYRPGPAYDWQYIDFTKLGNWNIGYLFVDLQKGEYTLAVCDDTYVGTSEKKQKDSGMIIFPNPSNGNFNIRANQAGIFEFYDVSGKIIDTVYIKDPAGQVTWRTDGLTMGTYFVRFKTENNLTIGIEKLILH